MKSLRLLVALVSALCAPASFAGPFYTGTLTAADLGACNSGIHYYGLVPVDGVVIKTGNGGSITPSSYAGYTIKSLVASADPSPQCQGTMTLVLAGSAPQNLFNTLFVNGQTYNSAAASEYGTGQGVTVWRWFNRPQGVPYKGNFAVFIF